MSHIPWRPEPIPPLDGLARGQALLEHLEGRRSIRSFADTPVPRAMIEVAVRAASTAPSGAHKQPWTFVCVSDPSIKRRIREEAEREERASYEGRMGDASLTHTPSPMGFLSEILGRPESEKPTILFPVGYPAPDATVPDLQRKSLDAVSVWFTEPESALEPDALAERARAPIAP